MDRQEVFLLYHKRLEMIKELLRVTKLVRLSGDKTKSEEEATEYIFMIEKRERMMIEIEKVNKCLSSSEYSYTTDEEIELIHMETKNVILEIIDLDKRNNLSIRKISDHFKNSLKNISIGKNIHSMYDNRNAISDGRMFDKKQ